MCGGTKDCHCVVCTMLYMRVTAGCVSLQCQNTAGNAGNSVYIVGGWVGPKLGAHACMYMHACTHGMLGGTEGQTRPVQQQKSTRGIKAVRSRCGAG